MSWLQKWSGLGKKEDTLLTLKLRLSRWRHLLKAQSTCLELLADLRDKSRGEYIFDSQYIYSTLGHVFQKARQMAYDSIVLRESPETGMYLWLDQLKEQATSFLGQWTKNKEALRDSGFSGQGSPERAEGNDEENGPGLNDFEQEPEFQMLNGLLRRLDPLETKDGRPSAETPILRYGLQETHEQVLSDLIKPGLIQNWITRGPALPIRDLSPYAFYVVDLGKAMVGSKSESKRPGFVERKALDCTPWPFLLKGLFSSSSGEGEALTGRHPSPAPLLVCNQDSLFLSGSSSSGPIILDVVLTSIQELNHFFIHWDLNLENHPLIQDLASLFDWTYHRKESVFEVSTFNRSPQEIENLVIKAGQGLSLWMNKGG